MDEANNHLFVSSAINFAFPSWFPVAVHAAALWLSITVHSCPLYVVVWVSSFLGIGCSLANWSPKVGQREMAEDMRTAFDEWAKYSRLKFVQVFSPDADIIVGFGSGHHGDK